MASMNAAAGRMLRELALLLTLDEGNRQAFRVRAYEKAADAVSALPDDVADLSTADLTAVEGIGSGSARKIVELVETGSVARLVELRDRYPAEFVELLKIPGLGPKTALLMRERLGITSVADLRAALAAQKVRDLPGMGARSEEKLSRSIERLGLHGKERRTPIIEALPVAETMVAALAEVPGVTDVRYCGSLRRFRDTVADIDILVAASNAEVVADRFVSLAEVSEVIAHGPSKSAVLTSAGLQIDLRVVTPDQFGAAILYFTGSKAHNIVLRQRAIERGWTLNEYALSDAETGDTVASHREEEIYRQLGLDFIEPVLREDFGEIEASASGTLPDLVRVADLRGDLHVHSSWSGDGRSTLDEMVAAAAERGLDYVAITEHGEDLAINGLSRERVQAEHREIERLRVAFPRLRILHGAELNIARDGDVDYDPGFLERFDWCVASVHSHFDLPEIEQTRRVVRAMENPAVDVIGHLTGRRIGKRPGIEVDVGAIFEAAAGTGTALEINSHLDRLDVPSDLLRRARATEGILFVISTDAHHTKELDQVHFGVRNAQRGWVERAAVLNTWPLDRFLARVGLEQNP